MQSMAICPPGAVPLWAYRIDPAPGRTAAFGQVGLRHASHRKPRHWQQANPSRFWQSKMQQSWREILPPGRLPGSWIRLGLRTWLRVVSATPSVVHQSDFARSAISRARSPHPATLRVPDTTTPPRASCRMLIAALRSLPCDTPHQVGAAGLSGMPDSGHGGIMFAGSAHFSRL